MQFHPTKIAGAFRVEPERMSDERGFFARTWCRREFAAAGLDPELVQCSLSFSPQRGTLRGMHYQKAPHGEVKLVRCTRGAVFDAIVDLRPDSPSYLAWDGCELSGENRTALYIPKGLAHGFLTLTGDSEVYYQMSQFFEASAASGVRWNDPAFGIAWPGEPVVISPRDANYPLWEGAKS